jgi:hypothetical protein
VTDLALQIGPVVGLAGAVGVGLVFIQAGISKVRNRDVLPGVITNYRLLPDALVAPIAAMLPSFEIALGLALAVSGLAVFAFGAIGLLLTFAVAMAINVKRGRTHIDCGCGRSQLRQAIGWPLVVRNVVMAALLLPALVPSGSIDGAGRAVAAAAGLGLFLLYQLFNAIIALSASPVATGRR